MLSRPIHPTDITEEIRQFTLGHESKEMKPTSSIAPAQSESAKRFLDKVKSHLTLATDPSVIERILFETKLDKIIPREPNFALYLKEITQHPQDMTAFLENMEFHILNHEAICPLLAYIEDNNLISMEELAQASSTLQLQINLLCLFEAFTFTMGNSSTLAEDVYTHIYARRNCRHPGNPIYSFFGAPSNTPLFERIKIPSIDPGMSVATRYKLLGGAKDSKKHADDFIARHKLSGLNRLCAELNDPEIKEPDTIAGMSLNILEASWQDTNNPHSALTGGIDNAKTGCALIAISEELNSITCITTKTAVMPKRTTINEDGTYSLLPGLKMPEGNKYTSEMKVPSQWVDLYNTWNLHFVIRNLDSCILPLKLLLPSVFAAQDYMFKEARGLSLFLFANIFVNEHTHKNPYFVTKFNFKNANKMLAEWGRINKNYSAQLMHQLCPTVETTPETLHTGLFHHHATASLIKNVCLFFYNSYKFRCTTALRPHKKKIESVVEVTGEDLKDPLVEELHAMACEINPTKVVLRR